MYKRLYRSDTNRIFAGIIGGVGEYFNVDPTLLRILWVVLLVFTAFVPGIVAYILALLIIPNRPQSSQQGFWDSDLQQKQERKDSDTIHL